MSDTIELLDSIGKNASLRHAAKDELTAALEHAGASAALRAAVAADDRALLSAELGSRMNQAPQVFNTPAHEEEEQEEEEEIPAREAPPVKTLKH
ncbi:hypothetical protein [Dyella sp.]|jgi:hypothetical protein|uniref:hypothetical protein n=1 Tax=Dyella sp. TaxID=1869338 RepID=UPI002D76FD35|nr:hypothetical protein [Dyella sp.]HET6432462.1 hypothetical protein [Dyella sp.]